MTTSVDLESLVSELFQTFLGRQASRAEIDYFKNASETGATVVEIVTAISNSQEARGRYENELFREMPVSRALSHARTLGASQLVRVDDIMNVIATLYETSLKRAPAYSEIAAKYSYFKSGTDLAEIVRSICQSEEAESVRSVGVIKNRISDRSRVAKYMTLVYNLVLKRPISEAEVDIWYASHQNGSDFADLAFQIAGSPEAQAVNSVSSLNALSPTRFVQMAFELLLGRGVKPSELVHFRDRIMKNELRRDDLVKDFFVHASKTVINSEMETPQAENNPGIARLFGTKKKYISVSEWEESRTAEPVTTGASATPLFSRFNFHSKGARLVSIVTSLYKGGKYIEAFVENMIAQSIFDDACELIIIDANSPEDEYNKIKKYLRAHKNINYIKCKDTIGIYEAWNLGVKSSTGAYCTNANVDDCRRHDSFELQASVLDALPFVDIAYQDVLFSFEPNIAFDDIRSVGFATELPIVSRYNLMEFNSPHNAPMWRRSLHDELGYFDETLRSAGDFDFWLRCVIARKTFYKINDPHVAYYVNPEGLSTRADTKGALEAHMLSKRHYRSMIPTPMTEDDGDFAARIASLSPGTPLTGSRYATVQAALRQLSATSRVAATRH